MGVSLLLLFNSSGEQDTALPVTPVLQPASGTIGSRAIGSGTIAGLDVEERLDAIREAFEPRRELTGSEEALLAIVATCLHGVLTTDYVILRGRDVRRSRVPVSQPDANSGSEPECRKDALKEAPSVTRRSLLVRTTRSGPTRRSSHARIRLQLRSWRACWSSGASV